MGYKQRAGVQKYPFYLTNRGYGVFVNHPGEVAFGLLSSHSRLRGSSSYRVPWLFEEEAVDVLRQFTRLKCRLMPYLYGEALKTVETGVPLMRAMLVEFPDDPTCAYLDRQYMLGDNLLVVPVFAADGEVTYYVPAGQWTHLVTGEVKQGPAWVTETHDALSLPLLVRPGAVLAVGNNDSQPDYAYAAGVTLQLYQFADGDTAQLTIPTLTGTVAAIFAVARHGDTMTVPKSGDAPGWRILVRGLSAIGTAEGCTVTMTAQGMLITPPATESTVTISL